MFAQQEAKRLKSPELLPVHLLLGVVSNPEGCYRGLQRCNVKVPDVTRAVEAFLQAQSDAAAAGPDTRSPLVGMFLESKGAPAAKAALPKGSKDAPFSKAVQKAFPLAMQVVRPTRAQGLGATRHALCFQRGACLTLSLGHPYRL
jgi:ATP-dependent Clp protease ATP-binding subunit ClpA